VPNVIGKLKNLKELYLHNNMIMFVDAELASLCKLEVLWIRWNMFSVLDDFIGSLKGLAYFDVDWEQQNKLSLLSNCLDQIASQEWSDEKVLSTDMGKLNTLIHGLEQLQKLTGPIGIEMLWNEWSRLNNLKYKLKNLTNLRELYCDGLDYPNGPIKLCPEGVIVNSETVQKTECCVEILINNIPASFVKSDAFEVIIELNEHHGKSLMEKIDFIELWR
jgi:Leucine-rich repeat (LRR) protein